MTTSRLSGHLLAIWGGYGSPGRTTVAIALARAFGLLSGSTLLIDADTYGADIGHLLAISGGPTIANAAHRCKRRELGRSLPELATKFAPGTDVLPGIPHPGLWRDLESPQIEAVLALAASAYQWVVIDTSPCIEQAEGCVSRNAVACTVLRSADHILLICRADPAGVQSFARALEELTDDLMVEISRVFVAVNRVPARSATRRMVRIQREINNASGITPLAWLSEDPAVLSALWAGRTLHDHAPRARFVGQIHDLAGCLDHLHEREVSA
ncbi:MAG: hypothetical protein DCC49_07190 [Acidobacteria bacterium]|nr:MAG: hypothetical protein DCC49_07190 [Acidobacteriota bacterium]